jgi:hypothetical protein
MKKLFSMILMLVMVVYLAACSKSDTTPEPIDFAEYDFTDLIACMGDMLDDDEGTICIQEDANQYMTAYANHYVQYLDSGAVVTGILRELSQTQYVGDIDILIDYSNLPNSMGEDSLHVFNQILQEIHNQLQNIVLNDIGVIKIVRPRVQFNGQPVVGLYDDIDIPAYQYLARPGTAEIYVIDLRYHQDIDLTDEYASFLEHLDIVSESLVADQFRLIRSNGTEFVRVALVPSEDTYDILVQGEGMGDTDLSVDDFKSIVEAQYPDYTYVTE